MASVESLSDFVARSLALGKPRTEIAQALARAGWTQAEIAAGLAAWADGPPGLPVPRPRPHVSARDAFFHALLFTALVMTAVFVTGLGFPLIARWLPDVGGLAQGFDRAGMRWDIAALFVAALAFLGLDLWSVRAMRRDVARRRLGLRKWFGHLAMFLTGLVLAGDLVFAIYTYLNGAFSAAVAARVGLVAATAGLILAYYRSDLGETPPATAGRGATAVAARAGLALLVAGLLVAGVAQVGGPETARREQRDALRLDQITSLNYAVTCTADARNGTLPEQLAIAPDCLGDASTTDPFTAAPYVYRRVSDQSFALCATYEEPQLLRDAWAHGADRLNLATGCIEFSYIRPGKGGPAP